ncbi:monosaccharide ABC transporter substrate-binding protein (CUT2 family) [Glaciihabitans tibetensis]|uniref:Monosaccharide ABC transporter substrate-binding protein (CUT2 family) n=1 Tax=Glaciihabitans tibetensis TaxID=1266600 RepID=A0A2T0VAD7_9MICO|nr:substrate-binding domain-containing protein [Glaciihabitans tibetensis]PRY67121.1 monosaccharide ABC transporter substrate-binding protein (CUT2 family) [Glaciihabitans tibetensis]
MAKPRSIPFAPLVTLAATALLALSGCAQSSAETAPAPETTAKAATADLPAPFDGDPVSVALVRQSGAGDYFESWGAGAEAQAALANIELTITDARNDNAKQASDLEQAIASEPDAIIVDHGQTDTLQPLITRAVDAGIPVVVYDLALTDATGVVTTSQSDESMATGVLDQLIEDVGAGAKVGYVSATGYAALDRRAVVWNEFVEENDLDVVFSTGKVTDSTASDNIPLVDAALKQNPDVQAIFAPYDEITKGVVQAVSQNNLSSSVKVYGIDISNADLEVINAENSPWVATSATDPTAIGAAVVRTLALQLAGELEETDVQFPAITITQEFLADNDVDNVAALRVAEPTLTLDTTLVTDWLPAAS